MIFLIFDINTEDFETKVKLIKIIKKFTYF